jgi:hypothetical protein
MESENSTSRDDKDTRLSQRKPRKPLHPKRIEISKKKTRKVKEKKGPTIKTNPWGRLILKESNLLDIYFTKFMRGETTDYMPMTKFLKRPTSFFLVEKYVYAAENLGSKKWILSYLAENTGAIHIIQKYIDDFDAECWEKLCMNENALEILEKNQDKIQQYFLKYICSNKNKNILSLFFPGFLELCGCGWHNLFRNPSALDLLLKNENTFLYGIAKAYTLTSPFSIIVKKNRICCELNQNMDQHQVDMLICVLESNVYILSQSDWVDLCATKNVVSFVSKHLNMIMEDGECWAALWSNPDAVVILQNNISSIKTIEQDDYMYEWYGSITENKNSKLFDILEKNPRAVTMDADYWYFVCQNPAAIDYILRHEKDIDKLLASDQSFGVHPYANLIHNTNPKAGHILERKMSFLSQDDIFFLYDSPLFDYLVYDIDYTKMKMLEMNQEFKNELAGYFYSPDRIQRLAKKNNKSFLEFLHEFHSIYS